MHTMGRRHPAGMVPVAKDGTMLEVKATSVDQFSVATFNLYNLQLPERRMNPGQNVWTAAEFKRKIAWITAQLHSVDADIVGLQEL